MPYDHFLQQRGCLGKKAFPAQANAEDAIFANHGVRAQEFHAYRCQFCHKWHIGHIKKGNQHGIHR